MRIISHYIGGWGLANEEIPFHVIWSSKDEIDFIEIDLPEEFRIVDLLNVEETDLGDKTLISKTITPGYFGGIVKCSELTEDDVSKKEIRVKFIRNDNVIFVQTLGTHIIRPRIKILEAPEKIEISDRLSKRDVNELIGLKVRHEGYGQTQIRIEAVAKGQILSRGRSLHLDVIRKLITMGADERENLGLKVQETDDKGVHVDEESLEEFIEELERMIRKGEVSAEETSEEELKEFVQWLIDSKKKDEWLRAIYSYVESFIIETLLSSLRRHPAEEVELLSPETTTVVKSRLTDLDIRLRYRDSLLNEYEPEVVRIKVADKRKEMRTFEIPINVDWERKSHMDFLEGE